MITFPLYKDDITYDEAAKNLQLNSNNIIESKIVNITDGNSTRITDFGKTVQVNSTYINLKNPKKSTNITENGEELIETTCHIFTEKLVATAKASVSSAFENLCDSGQLITHIDKMESKLISELNAIKEMVLKMEATILDLDAKLSKAAKESAKKYLTSANNNHFLHY
ncbi:hypothetical protein O3M35_005942 [Rhynocoris fuscipes]|uniref:Uncharacterized protein n=1 Tax=Rhynocoris fuscipes TaxID=488301 RepID=A0AAW1DF51_9HEMI